MADPNNDTSTLASDFLDKLKHIKSLFMAHSALENAGGATVTIPGKPQSDISGVAKAAKEAGDRMEADKAAKAAQGTNRVQGPASK